jgi:hypothetical protein
MLTVQKRYFQAFLHQNWWYIIKHLNKIYSIINTKGDPKDLVSKNRNQRKTELSKTTSGSKETQYPNQRDKRLKEKISQCETEHTAQEILRSKITPKSVNQ